jgi:probable rRNA maturation factor
MAKVQIKNQQKMPIDRSLLRRTVKLILVNALESQKAEVSLLLLDDCGITALNEQYRGKPRPTDVLSFPLYTAEELTDMQPEVLGDVVISIETAARQAERAGCALWEEMTRLLVHGILHLLGFDHENNAAGARAMRARERRILAALLEDERIAGAMLS